MRVESSVVARGEGELSGVMGVDVACACACVCMRVRVRVRV